jgi:hypothetical protein
MTMDAFYTSPMGIKDVGYVGNGAYSKYEVPKEALEYALKRSPFAAGSRRHAGFHPPLTEPGA